MKKGDANLKVRKIAQKFLIPLLALAVVVAPAKLAYADSFKVVTLGADLTDEQKKEMLKYFDVDENEANIIEVTNAEENKYLGDVASKSQIGTKAISSSYVEPTSDGGLDISVNNMSWISESMIENALITAGIENAKVKVSAPFKVSGTAALTGILKGFENSKGGEKIDEDNKKAANEELVVTGNLGDKVGKDEAASLINEIKKEVVEKKPESKEEIRDIVINVANQFNINLDDADVEKITALMDKIKGLNIDTDQLKDQLNAVSKKLKGTLSSEEAQGFFAKLIEAIKAFFESLFN